MYIAKNYKTDATDPDNPVEKTVPIEGKMTLDISQAIDYDELPWSNIESSISNSSTTITRRIAGAGEINISPIVGFYNDTPAIGRYILNPRRANIRHIYSSSSNTWSVDYNTTNISNIAKEI